MSSYRPRYNDFPPPPPPPDLPPLPPGPPPPHDPYRGGDHWSPRSPERFPRQDFSFRNHGSAPQHPREQYRPPQSNGTRRRNNQNDNRNLNRTQRGHYNRGGRGPRYATSDRPLLNQKYGGDEDFEMLGVPDGTVKYMNPEDVSDSSEEEMDVSDSDREEGEILNVGLDGNADGEAMEPPNKRRAVGAVEKEAAAEPKWSNPDPYYVLPPIDESLTRKRKDPVKQIRKSRITAETAAAEGNLADKTPVEVKAEVNQVAANDDFISFDVDGGEDLIEKDVSVSEEDSDFEGGVGVPGAPTGPRKAKASRDGQYRSLPLKDIQNSNRTPPSADHSFPAQLYQLDKMRVRNSNGPPSSPPVPTQIILDTPQEARAAQSYGEYIALTADLDSSLGSRKRNHDDEIKGGTRYSGKKGKGETPGGSLLEEWIPEGSINPTPWLKKSGYITAHAGFRLHKEVCDFYDFVRPQKFEQVVREELLSRLQAAVNTEMPKCRVHCFGSFAAGLYLPNADMDVVVLSDSYCTHGEKVVCQTNSKMRKFGDFVTRSKLAQPGSVELIFGAKVPLVKFVDRITAIRIDVSFENDTGVVANNTFNDWKQQFPAMPVLVTVVKQFLMMRGLNEVMNGGIGGFSVTCLVTSLLQNMPRVQSGEMAPEEHLGEMLIEFLDFYGNRFDISRTGITMNPPGYFDKHAYNRPSFKGPIYQANKADRIAIMDPNKLDNDISGGSRNVLAIFDRLSRAHTEILRAMKTPGRISLLDWMLGGNYEPFVWQRNHLRELYNKRHFGNPELQIEQLMEITLAAADERRPTELYETTKSRDAQGENLQVSNKKLKEIRNTLPMTNVQRADELRRQFPDIPNIPAEVSKSQRQRLAPRYEEMRKINNGTAAMSSALVTGSNENQQISSSATVIKAGLRADVTPVVKPKVTPKLTKLEVKRQQSRSSQLKREFPGAASRIPDLVGRQAFKKLTLDLTRGDPRRGDIPSRRQVAQPRTTPQTLTTKPAPAKYGQMLPVSAPYPLSNRMAPPSMARRAEVARNLAGTSRSEAILLD